MNAQIEAIVLKSFDYQDYHKIVKLISPSHGLISVFISYANQKKSRYRALAEPLTLVTMTVKSPRTENDGLFYLVHGDIQDGFYDLKMDYEKVMYFYEMAQIIISGDIDLGELPYAYRTLKGVLEAEAATSFDLGLGVVIFKVKMMVATGITPAVDGCVECGRTNEIVTASVSAGGLICASCYTGDGIWLATELISLWRGLFKLPLDSLFQLEVGGEELELLETWMNSYYEMYSNVRFAKKLKT